MIKNLLIVFATCVVTVFILEAAVRIFSNVRTEPHPKNLYVADPDVGYRNNPGFETDYYGVNVRFNQQSLRENTDCGPKDSLTYRILLLGDSQTFNGAVPLEDTYGKVLEKLLNKDGSGSRFQVLNAGVSGYGTVNESAFLSKFGPELNPDLVIIGFYVNDVFENSGGILQKTVRDGYLIGTDTQITGNPIILPYWLKRFLRLHSHLYHFVTYRWDLLKGQFYAPWKEIYSKNMPGYISTNWEKTFSGINDIKQWCEKNRRELLFVYIPQALQIEEKLWSSMNTEDARYDRILPNTMLSGYCSKEKIACFDPYDAFKEEQNKTEIYGKVDKHFSIDGNHFFGQLLYNYIISTILVR